MKKLYMLALAMGAAFVIQAQAPTPELLYYKFDGTGTTVPNQALTPPPGTGTATIQGAITQNPGNLCNGSLIGSGLASSTDFLNTNWAPNLGTGSWSIVWRSTGISTNSTLYYIFGDAGSTSFRCFTNGVAGSTNWIIRGAGITDTYINGGALSTPTMCAFVYDQAAGQMRGYLNGVLVSTVAQGAVNLTGTGPFKVMGYGSNIGAPSGGELDEFGIYNRALTPTEIATLYAPYIGSFLGPDLSVCQGDSVQLTPSANYGGNFLWSNGSTNDTTFASVAGTYYVDITGGCAQGTDTVNVTVNPASTNTISAANCSSYLSPAGNTYTTTGVYVDTLTALSGCDSLITINLTINQPTTSSITVSSCDASYTAPSGATFTTSGTYTDVIPNVAGCDSTITIDLTFNSATSASITAQSCDSYTAPSGAVFTTSGMFMDTIANVAGCDSVITINLTVNYTTGAALTPMVCDSYSSPAGNVYTTSGLYYDTLVNAGGCDSIISINLVVMNSSSSSMTATSCGAYTSPAGNVYTTSGTYVDSLVTVGGCDSIVTINLTVNQNPTVTGTTSASTVCLDDADVTLTGTPAGGTWSGPGVTGSNFDPSVGAGAQVLTYSYTDNNNCSGTAVVTVNVNACVGIAEQQDGSAVKVYPNPATDFINVVIVPTENGQVQVQMFDLSGKATSEQFAFNVSGNMSNTLPVNTANIASGAYLMRVTNGTQVSVTRVVIRR
jgi:hypothetical protein